MTTTNKLRLVVFLLLLALVITALLKENPALAQHRFYWPRFYIHK